MFSLPHLQKDFLFSLLSISLLCCLSVMAGSNDSTCTIHNKHRGLLCKFGIGNIRRTPPNGLATRTPALDIPSQVVPEIDEKSIHPVVGRAHPHGLWHLGMQAKREKP
jgi:hypothetical protein